MTRFALTLVEGEGAVELRPRIATHKSQHFGKVNQRLCVCVQQVRLLGERGCLAGEPLALIVLAASCEHFSTHLAPQHLREALLVRGRLAPTLEPLLGLIVSAELEKRPGAVAAEPHESCITRRS